MIYRRVIIFVFAVFVFAAFLSSPVGRDLLHRPGVIFFMAHIVPFIFVLLPLVDALLRRTVYPEGIRGERQMDRIRNLQHRLWGWTGVGLVIVVLHQLWCLKSGREGFISDYLLIPWFIGFFLQILHRPLLQAKKPTADSDVFMPATDRAASLTPRHTISTPHKRMWLILWGIWAAVAIICMCFLAVRPRGFFDDDVFTPLFTASVPLIIGPFALRWWLQRPEPMDPAGSSRLAAAYVRLRRIKAWSILIMSLLYASIFLSMALLRASGNSIAVGRLVMASMLGAVLASGIVPATYNRARKKVAKLLRDLANESEASPEKL